MTDLPGVSYLYTLATLSVTFVGFSALVVYLRQTAGGEMSKLDVLLTRIFIQLGFIVVAGAMLPPMLSLFRMPSDLIWRAASVASALPTLFFALTYPWRRRGASGIPTPLVVWIDVLVLALASATLASNAAGVWGEPGPGPYAAALTAILFLGGLAYLQALNTLLTHHRESR